MNGPTRLETAAGREQIVDLAAIRRRRRVLRFGPLPQPDMFDTGVADDDDNGICRPPITREALAKAEPDMHDLLRYWEQMGDRGIPRFADFNPERVRAFGLLHRVNVVNVAADHPADFFIEHHGRQRSFDGARDYTGLHIGDYPVPLFAEALMVDYNTAKMTGLPAIHAVAVSLPETFLAYKRLMLPFSGADGRVERILVAFRTQPL